jgi:hypothetical protein
MAALKPALHLIFMKKFYLLSLFLSINVLLFSQENKPAGEEFETAFVASKTGGLIVYSGEDHSFTIEVKAKDVKTTGQANYLVIGDQIVQSAILPIPKKTDLESMTMIRQKEILKTYINYELDYFKNSLKQEYSNLKMEWVIINGQQFVYWHFDMPKGDNKHVKKQIYLSSICFDQILDLNAPVFEDYYKAKDILTQMANTLKLYNSHLDLAALSAQAKK